VRDRFARRLEGPAADEPSALRRATGARLDARTDPATVARVGPQIPQLDDEPRTACIASRGALDVVLQHAWALAEPSDEHIDIAVPVEVAERRGAIAMRLVEPRTRRRRRHAFEALDGRDLDRRMLELLEEDAALRGRK